MNINHGLDRAATAPNPPSPGRNSSGHFAPGNQLGAQGRPPREREQAAITALRKAATDEDLDAIAAFIVERARGGSWPAIRFLFDYLVGRPTLRVESSARDAGALWVFIQQIQSGVQASQVIDAAPVNEVAPGDG